jgi:hypothetical protein
VAAICIIIKNTALHVTPMHKSPFSRTDDLITIRQFIFFVSYSMMLYLTQTIKTAEWFDE